MFSFIKWSIQQTINLLSIINTHNLVSFLRNIYLILKNNVGIWQITLKIIVNIKFPKYKIKKFLYQKNITWTTLLNVHRIWFSKYIL